ncbi:MAG: electron transfer flavoprotein subunit alpha/FixB family protein [Actinomycetota bacterium]
MNTRVLVLIEHDRGAMSEASLEALTFARDVAGQIGGASVEALLIGAAASDLAARCGEFGASTCHVADDPLLADYGPDAWSAVVASAASTLSPAAIVACGTDRGNEVLAHTAAELDLPFVANCISVKVADEWEMTRVQWGGSLNEDARLTSSLPIVTVAHHAVEATPAGIAGAGTAQLLEVSLDESVAATMVQDRIVLSEGVTLATAPVVVGGGRGVGSAEGFAVLEELAEKLGGVVGCSRAVTNNGWRPHSDQVGQTGTRIAPQLYIACGISGAIQHWVGAKAAKKILAINTDPDANMVVKADYAVIGDLFEVLPAIE